MHLDLPPKIQIDNGRITRRINNEGRIIGSRVRHVTWLHTYHSRSVIDHYQFHAGYRLGFLWKMVCGSVNMPRMRFDDLPRVILAQFGDEGFATELREAIKSIRNLKAREAVIDLSVFDMEMGKRRIDRCREGLSDMADFQKKRRNGY